jgi:DNA-binding Lrp family transcriptional regulator
MQVGETISDDTHADLDRRIVLATQAGLPLDPSPYRCLARRLGVDDQTVKTRLETMLADGTIRRIAAIPNHFRLGYTANGMSVWDVHDSHVDSLGEAVGRLEFVSHCYRRPRHPPSWPYNLFAMVHGRSREEVEAQVRVVADLLGTHCRASDILYSKRILKKTGLRFVPTPPTQGAEPATVHG